MFTDITKESFEVALVFTPFNHIYGLLTAHTLMWLGHSTVIHRGFNMLEVLMSIPKHRITTLYLVSSAKHKQRPFMIHKLARRI